MNGFSQGLLWAFFIIFSLLILSGVFITFYSILNSNPESEMNKSETALSFEIEGDKIKFEINTMIPGIVLLSLGAFGLLLLLIKVPIIPLNAKQAKDVIYGSIGIREIKSVQTPLLISWILVIANKAIRPKR